MRTGPLEQRPLLVSSPPACPESSLKLDTHNRQKSSRPQRSVLSSEGAPRTYSLNLVRMGGHAITCGSNSPPPCWRWRCAKSAGRSRFDCDSQDLVSEDGEGVQCTSCFPPGLAQTFDEMCVVFWPKPRCSVAHIHVEYARCP